MASWPQPSVASSSGTPQPEGTSGCSGEMGQMGQHGTLPVTFPQIPFNKRKGVGREEEWGKNNKRSFIKILRQITDKTAK